ncbi:protein AAR2 homolog isoform X8 [Zingiber officinale]|uniref:protein AAR2 homolog isoform X8 n=1 Tax=Zingiber officinale TaxID=94328 RepID=UPI001C4CED7D|nr:protein AAR2 homolog isoform X8 [Zingiber officinale]
MDQETALDLVKKGSTVLLLDVPQFTLLGIDTQMFSVGPMFKGIKMIPPGIHFIYYSSSNKEGNEFSPMVGFFISTRSAEVVVRKWNPSEERLVQISEEEEGRYSEGVRCLEFDSHLGPYVLNQYGEWKQLSNYITESTIEKIEPIGGDITIAYESGLIEVPKTAMEKQLIEQLKSNTFSKLEREEHYKHGCYYTPIPNSVNHKGISAEELTAINLDKTKLLEKILIKDYGGEEDSLLGELQFSFVAFMMGQSLEAFKQWKSFVILLFSCIEAPLKTRTRLFSKFIKVIFHQLNHGFQRNKNHSNNTGKEISLFLDEAWFSKEIFLFRLCKDFFPLVLDSSVVDGDLPYWTRKLKVLLETALGWDFADDEDDEFSPVIVPCDEVN